MASLRETVTIRQRELSSDSGQLDLDNDLLKRIYLARRVTSNAELDYALGKLPQPSTMMGIDQAASLLADSLLDDQHILIIGDFDADGATSTALMVRGLRAMGAAQVGYLVPDRFRFGYGLTPEIVDVALPSRPDLVITVDNGIASLDGVRHAREHGIRVLVTDHHLPGSELPVADAIINPNQPGDSFPSKNIAGVGVAFYLLMALRQELRERRWFDRRRLAEPALAELLDLVALGTVADVVPLDHVNRILVSQGLARINARRCRPGILALLDIAGRKPGNLVTADLGFAVAPRLNAAGRLDNMATGIECLLADDPEQATQLAARLDRLNRERREIENDMRLQALDEVRRLGLHADREMPAGLCLFDSDWHQGVIGIVASRIKERLHRPVIAFAPAGEPGSEQPTDELKGSARSIRGLHIRDALDAIATRQPGLIRRFGGHAMAAGLTLPRENLDAFKQAFDDQVRAMLDSDDLQRVLLTDGQLKGEQLNLNTAMMLRRAGPWGQRFPEPLFEGYFEVIDRRVVGGHHLKMQLAQGDQTLDAIMFNIDEGDEARVRGRQHAVYRLDVNEFRGRRTVQLLIEYLQPC
jgi:single-stranded-DNA-specific exonuclease